MTSPLNLSSLAKPDIPAVEAFLEFIEPQTEEKPRFISAAMTGDRERFFFETRPHLTRIEDVREWDHSPSLDKEGFTLIHKPSNVDDLYDDEAISKHYRPEVQRLVTDVLNAEEVVVFDVTRRSDSKEGASNPDGVRAPANKIHVDYTKTSGPQRARDVFGPKRVQRALASGQPIVQVNVWRPIRGPVQRSPLALADASSVDSSALIATDQVFVDRVGEIYHLAHQPHQRWAYVSNMRPEEVIIIKGYDSRSDGRARFTPHTAFDLPNESSAPARHSIEVRTFAILPTPKS